MLMGATLSMGTMMMMMPTSTVVHTVSTSRTPTTTSRAPTPSTSTSRAPSNSLDRSRVGVSRNQSQSINHSHSITSFIRPARPTAIFFFEIFCVRGGRARAMEGTDWGVMIGESDTCPDRQGQRKRKFRNSVETIEGGSEGVWCQP